MAWTEAQIRDFHIAQFRSVESSRRARARYEKERAGVGIDSGEVRSVDDVSTAELYLDILGMSEDDKTRLRTQIASCYRMLDSRL